MGRTRKDQLTHDYLRLLDRRLASLPGSRRRQIREEVRAHIEDGCRRLAPENEAGVRQLLEQLGGPGENAREAGADLHRRTWPEALVPVLLLFGGFVFVVGWLVGGAIRWASPVWRLRDKLMGTLILPFELLGWLRHPPRRLGRPAPLGHRLPHRARTARAATEAVVKA